MNWGFVLLISLASISISQVVRVIALQKLLKPYISLDFATGYLANGLSLLLNTILPFRFGEFIKAVYISRHYNASLSVTLPAVFIEKLIDISGFTLLLTFFAFSGTVDLYVVIQALVIPLLLLILLISGLIGLSKYHPAYPGKYWSIKLAIFSVNKYLRQLSYLQVLQAIIFVFSSWIFFSFGISTLIQIYPISIPLWISHNLSFAGFIWNFSSTEGLIIWLLSLLGIAIPFTISFLYHNLRKDVSKQTSSPSSPVGSIISDSWPEWTRIGGSRDNTSRLLKLIEKNGLTLHRILSGGSGALVALTELNQQETIIKISEGDTSARLFEQALFMQKNKNQYSFPEVTVIQNTKQATVLSIEYLSDAIPLGDFFHEGYRDHNQVDSKFQLIFQSIENSHGELIDVEKSESQRVFNQFLYQKLTPTLDQCVRFAPELPISDFVTINGKKLIGIKGILDSIEKEKDAFRPSLYAHSIHGDTTFSNIFIEKQSNGYRIRFIDPNPSQPYNSPAIDFAKLLQSTMGNYEYLFENSTLISLTNSHVFFTEETEHYYRDFNFYIANRFIDNRALYREIQFQLFAHFVRLMPYRIANDRLRAPIFWGKMLEVGNLLINHHEL